MLENRVFSEARLPEPASLLLLGTGSSAFGRGGSGADSLCRCYSMLLTPEGGFIHGRHLILALVLMFTLLGATTAQSDPITIVDTGYPLVPTRASDCIITVCTFSSSPGSSASSRP